jgi:two-component system response regulator NreC
MSKIRIVIADDHAILREGVRLVLQSQPDIEVVGEASNGREAVAKAGELQPDIVLMDIAMPEMNGLEATREIKRQWPEVEVLALTMHDDYEYFLALLHHGASGYVLKGASSAQLLAAIHAVHEGGVYIHPSVAKNLVADYISRMEPGEEKARYDGLSERERQVLKLVAEGKTSQEVADELVVSVNTIQTHRAHIMTKLNLRNRGDIVRYALRKGLINE